MHVLVTGGAGYIGSHTCKHLLEAGHRVTAIDNLDRGHAEPMAMLTQRFPGQFEFHRADITDAAQLSEVIQPGTFDAVMHFAALAYVGESVDRPMDYHRINVLGSINLLDACLAANPDEGRDTARGEGIPRFVFSSSCATFGSPPGNQIPVRETCPQEPESPYGRSKLMFEWILRDVFDRQRVIGKPMAVSMLRYFNVAGCDTTGLLGEDHDPETHLIPVALQTALGQREKISIMGTDYPTPDGTCVRDYVHVDDLARAHILAMNAVEPGEMKDFNLGLGQGFSVREVVEACRRVTGIDFPVEEGARRAGDAVALYADPTKIQAELGWSPQINELDEIIASAWSWMQANPHGYTPFRGA